MDNDSFRLPLPSAVAFCMATLVTAYLTPLCKGANASAGVPERLRLERYAPIAGLVVLQARPRHPLMVMRDGVVGRLDLKRMTISHRMGTAWNAVVLRSPGRRPQQVAMFCTYPVFSPNGRCFVTLVSAGLQPMSPMEPNFQTAWQVWSVARGRALGTLRSQLVPPRGPGRLVYTDGGRKLAGFGGGNLYFLNPNLAIRPRLAGAWGAGSFHVVGLRAEPRGPYLLAKCAAPGRAEVWDSRNQRRVVIIPPPAHVSWSLYPPWHAAIGSNRVAIAWSHHLTIYRASTGHQLADRRLSGVCGRLALAAGSRFVAALVGANASRAKLEVFKASAGLVRCAESAPILVGHIANVRLAWWGANRIVACAPNWIRIWHVVVQPARGH